MRPTEMNHSPWNVARALDLPLWAPTAGHRDGEALIVGRYHTTDDKGNETSEALLVRVTGSPQQQFRVRTAVSNGEVKMDAILADPAAYRLFPPYKHIAAVTSDPKCMRLLYKLIMFPKGSDHAMWMQEGISDSVASAFRKVLRTINEHYVTGDLDLQEDVKSEESLVVSLMLTLTNVEFCSFKAFPGLILSRRQWQEYLEALQAGARYTAFEWQHALHMIAHLPEVGLELIDNCPLGMLAAYDSLRLNGKLPLGTFAITDRDLFDEMFLVKASIERTAEEEGTTQEPLRNEISSAKYLFPTQLLRKLEIVGRDQLVRDLMMAAELFPCRDKDEQGLFLDQLRTDVDLQHPRGTYYALVL
jgi:hypothetical protein